MLNGDVEAGLSLIHQAIPMIVSPSSLAEAYIDLCYAYLDLNDLEKAHSYGEAGLRIATEERQIRNAHFLLGEVACKRNDTAAAEVHFGELARFYPNFRHLKNLLMGVDLRSMVNLKA